MFLTDWLIWLVQEYLPSLVEYLLSRIEAIFNPFGFEFLNFAYVLLLQLPATDPYFDNALYNVISFVELLLPVLGMFGYFVDVPVIMTAAVFVFTIELLFTPLRIWLFIKRLIPFF